MFDFEWVQPKQECSEVVDLRYNQCNQDEYLAVAVIKDASADLSPDGEQYAFYNLNLSDYELNLLAQIHIMDFNVLATVSFVQDFPEKISSFLGSVLECGDNLLVPTQVSLIALKLISNIIAASNYSDATVNFIAYNNGDSSYYPCWHIDKTHAEELREPFLGNQNVYIVTLKGPSTLYHKMDHDIRLKFNLLANESRHSYGYDKFVHYVKNEGIYALLSNSNSESAAFGKGAVHLAGRWSGTVHSTPEGAERLVLIVTPGDKDAIERLHHT